MRLSCAWLRSSLSAGTCRCCSSSWWSSRCVQLHGARVGRAWGTCQTQLNCTVPCWAVPCQTRPSSAILCHLVPNQAQLCHSVPCYAKLDSALASHPILSHIIPSHALPSCAVPHLVAGLPHLLHHRSSSGSSTSAGWMWRRCGSTSTSLARGARPRETRPRGTHPRGTPQPRFPTSASAGTAWRRRSSAGRYRGD